MGERLVNGSFYTLSTIDVSLIPCVSPSLFFLEITMHRLLKGIR